MGAIGQNAACYRNALSDEASSGSRAPERRNLGAPMPFNKGSLSRTLAYEPGHVLGLTHPDRSTQVSHGFLIGGRKVVSRLTPAEMQIGRDFMSHPLVSFQPSCISQLIRQDTTMHMALAISIRGIVFSCSFSIRQAIFEISKSVSIFYPDVTGWIRQVRRCAC